MTFDYTLYKNNIDIGNLQIDEKIIEEVANSIGATSYRNEDTHTTFIKCSNCGWWHKKEIDYKGLCYNCDYIRRIDEWLDFYDQELQKHFDGDVDNYLEDFVITFKGKTLKLDFGASEDAHFVKGIYNLLEELKEENEL